MTYYFIPINKVIFCLLLINASILEAHQITSSQEHSLSSIESVNSTVSNFFSDWIQQKHHLVIDLFECNPEKIRQASSVENALLSSAAATNTIIIGKNFHQFSPSGVSGSLILEKTHLTIHTWPEAHGYCAIDIFTNDPTNNSAILTLIKEQFEAKSCSFIDIERGKQNPTWSCHDGSMLFRENLDPLNGFKTTITTKNLLTAKNSEFQSIKVYDTDAVGKMLVIDDIIQLTEYDNAAYHEMIVHVPMQAHPNPRRVLIIGGGDGGALVELNKYKNLEEIVICDIDPMVAQITGNYFPVFAKAYQDPRIRQLFQDGTQLIKTFKNYFDVIIVDCTDFYGVAAPLARKDFYENIHDALTDDGIMVIQAESLYYDRNFIASLYKQVQEIFPKIGYYHTLVPTYPSGTIGFVFGSKKYSHSEQLGNNSQQLENLEYYNTEMHSASFAMPTFLKKLLSHH